METIETKLRQYELFIMVVLGKKMRQKIDNNEIKKQLAKRKSELADEILGLMKGCRPKSIVFDVEGDTYGHGDADGYNRGIDDYERNLSKLVKGEKSGTQGQ